MKSQWTDADAQKAVKEYGVKGISEDLALRTYTTQLLGRDPMLVLHGGGNTSVKTRMTDLIGEEHDVLCVKGSGWDMGVIEPAGLPAVKLKPLQKLRSRKDLSDEDMVNFQRANLLDTFAPNPSVETLLHAFLPHKFVDHTHAAAVLSLVDQPNGEEMVQEVYGAKMGFVPYVISGFTLSKLAAEVYDQDPKVEGLILHKHGIFTFGKSAKEAYELMIEHITKAETRLAKGRRNNFAVAKLPAAVAPASEIAPIVRGACAVAPAHDDADPGRWVMAHRATPEIMAYVNGADVADYGRRGVPTPDHIIRTKNLAMVLLAPKAGDGEAFSKSVRDAVAAYVKDYDAYFAAENKRVGGIKTKLDPMPRVVLVPGVGMFGLGKSSKEAAIAADLAENAIHVVTEAEAIGKYAPLDASNLFDIEYWSLEQAKLKGNVEKAFSGQIVVVTGGGGAIGKATAKAFAAEGATPVLLDLDEEAAMAAAAAMKSSGGMGLGCDVTKRESVAAAFAKISASYGGVDIVVSNAGAAWGGRIGEVSDEVLRQSFELNFFAHQSVAQAAVRIMRQQGTGGCLLFNCSKQAVNPGPDFGPYGLPKAATLFLMRQYALDYGSDGIRSNGVNADRIRSGLLTNDMIAKRSTARGLSEADYMGGNLLKREVTAGDVAQAFVALAKARKTTGHIETVDGGNIAAALR